MVLANPTYMHRIYMVIINPTYNSARKPPVENHRYACIIVTMSSCVSFLGGLPASRLRGTTARPSTTAALNITVQNLLLATKEQGCSCLPPLQVYCCSMK